jgi:hypothetical protein
MINQPNPGRSRFGKLTDVIKAIFFPSAPPRGPVQPDNMSRPAVFPSRANTREDQSVARRNLYRWLMNVPHRDYRPVVAAFREALEDDPDFTARACIWLNSRESGQQIRDIQDVACITLLQAPSMYHTYREAGRCVLLGEDFYSGCGMPGLPPYRLFRLVEHISMSDRKVPRLIRSIVADYFAGLEKNPVRLDGAALRNRRAMKAAWVSFHMIPSNFPRIHAILFGQPPPDSRLASLKNIAAMQDPTLQAMAIVENHIPYVIATSIIKQWTPAVGVAFIEAMSPTEALNSRAWIERSGLLVHPEVRDLYLSKVKGARGSVASMSHRASAQGQDAEVEAAMQQAREATVAAGRRIERDTLLLVDKSGSMQIAINAAQQFGARISPLCDGRLVVVAFDTHAREIKVEDTASLISWESAFRGIKAGGGTSIGSGLKYALDMGFQPQQVVIITDTGENTNPLLVNVARQFANPPEFIFIVVPTHDRGIVIGDLRDKGYQVEVFEINDPGDYWIYDQVASILGGPPSASLVDQILQTQLPRRAA